MWNIQEIKLRKKNDVENSIFLCYKSVAFESTKLQDPEALAWITVY